ncbi:G-box binding factor 3 [Prunus dulcis]|uniref:G-box binding factor 3 n=1 Tax=Prunus dulcis TaxID=3755 RepID=A0A4Y1RHI3_PRUDU|nr:G-box binding factor 3 [Prunus dulcis]
MVEKLSRKKKSPVFRSEYAAVKSNLTLSCKKIIGQHGPRCEKEVEGLDGTAVPVGYDSLKDTGHPVLEASKRQQLPVSFMMLSPDVANLNFDSVTMCSLEQNIDGLTDGSDGNTKEDNHHTQRNNGSGSMRFADNDVKVHTQVRPTTNGEVNENSTNASGTGPPAGFLGVSLRSPYEKIGISTAFVAPSAGAGLPFDAMVLDERQVKREKRKQANRESARRSRMRKQAEYEELVRTFESLNTEKMALKSKLEELKGDSEKLRLENATLMEKLKHAQVVPKGGIASVEIEVDLDLPTGTENILSNLGSVSRNAQLDCEAHESSMSETKLHAVAAR